MIVVTTFREVCSETRKEIYTDHWGMYNSYGEAKKAYDRDLEDPSIWSSSIAETVESTDYSAETLISKIDLEMLKRQKAILINMIEDWTQCSDPDQRKDGEEMEGLLSLLDSIQDQAVEYGYGKEDVIYNLTHD